MYIKISSDIFYDDNLAASEKLFMAYLRSVEGVKTKATNKVFAEIFSVSPRQISRWVARLEECGYIETEQDIGYSRIIKISEGDYE